VLVLAPHSLSCASGGLFFAGVLVPCSQVVPLCSKEQVIPCCSLVPSPYRGEQEERLTGVLAAQLAGVLAGVLVTPLAGDLLVLSVDQPRMPSSAVKMSVNVGVSVACTFDCE